MQDILVVVDMQNDFIDGTLGTKEAVTIVPKVEEKIRNFKGTVLSVPFSLYRLDSPRTAS